MSDGERIREFLADQEYLVVAVMLDDSTPWSVVVRSKLQWKNAFEWDSKPDTMHSKAIEKRPKISLMCFDKTGETQLGFYAQGKAEKTERNDNRDTWRYRFVAEKAWMNDETHVKREVELE